MSAVAAPPVAMPCIKVLALSLEIIQTSVAISLAVMAIDPQAVTVGELEQFKADIMRQEQMTQAYLALFLDAGLGLV